jgi:hypothetical protein
MKTRPALLMSLCANLLSYFTAPGAIASEKPASPSPLLYRMSQLEQAKQRATAEGKPIGWIASYPEYLQPYPNLLGKGSHAATAYAVRALQKETILVFSDGRTENHAEPRIVDEALHSPDPHYNIPGVIILTPSLDKIIAKIPYEADSQERIKKFTDALKKIRDKDSWRQKEPGK